MAFRNVLPNQALPVWGGALRGVCDPRTVASEPPMDGFTGVPESRLPHCRDRQSGEIQGPAYNIGARKRAVCDFLLLATFAGAP